MAAYKFSIQQGVIEDISRAFEEFECLRNEMQDTFDNMEGGNLGHTQKAEMAQEAADQLDQAQEPEIPDAVSGLPITYGVTVSTRKGRGPSRAVRLSNAVEVLQAACNALEEYIDTTQEARDELDVEEAETEGVLSDEAQLDLERRQEELDELFDEASTLKDELEFAISDVKGVEFPGMYG